MGNKVLIFRKNQQGKQCIIFGLFTCQVGWKVSCFFFFFFWLPCEMKMSSLLTYSCWTQLLKIRWFVVILCSIWSAAMLYWKMKKSCLMFCASFCSYWYHLSSILHSTTLAVNNLINETIVQCIFFVKICATLQYLIVTKIHSKVKLNVLTCHWSVNHNSNTIYYRGSKNYEFPFRDRTEKRIVMVK